jgi:hypothetical protein
MSRLSLLSWSKLFRDSFDMLVAYYDAAIEEADANATTRDMLIKQQAELMAKVLAMKAMQTA